ncbi:hypothetical protein RR46_12247 [Papilio xuthus]|uniref:Uncharacterized protein n=1 Tax=Papilio xuthus TaxID=66420 RepID=A0A194PQK1_PAPXU|nr:hypothetical protein RR46_12247 [Papilio xuthus]
MTQVLKFSAGIQLTMYTLTGANDVVPGQRYCPIKLAYCNYSTSQIVLLPAGCRFLAGDVNFPRAGSGEGGDGKQSGQQEKERVAHQAHRTLSTSHQSHHPALILLLIPR